VEGRSLLPTLEGKVRAGHKTLFWEHMGNKAVRKGPWKIVSVEKGEWELYNIENIEKDRAELHNLREAEPAKLAELVQDYEHWAAKVGVKTMEERRTPRA
jgi:arylsulfatase A-like enzyme